jgi:hypothetical protein
MKLPILLLPTLLTICFVAVSLAHTNPVQAPTAQSSRITEIRELDRARDEISARLSALKAAPHNVVPRGISASTTPASPVAMPAQFPPAIPATGNTRHGNS